MSAPYTVRLDQEAARELAQRGATLLLLGVPEGAAVGIDQQARVGAAGACGQGAWRRQQARCFRWLGTLHTVVETAKRAVCAAPAASDQHRGGRTPAAVASHPPARPAHPISPSSPALSVSCLLSVNNS